MFQLIVFSDHTSGIHEALAEQIKRLSVKLDRHTFESPGRQQNTKRRMPTRLPLQQQAIRRHSNVVLRVDLG